MLFDVLFLADHRGLFGELAIEYADGAQELLGAEAVEVDLFVGVFAAKALFGDVGLVVHGRC